MSGLTVFGYTILKSQPEREIQKLFRRYEKELSEQKLKMFDDITEWGDAMIRSIYRHANKQKYLLEKEYTNKISYLDKKCEQFVEELRVHEQVDNTEHITQLLDQCKALNFQLAELEHHGQAIPFIEVPSSDPLVNNRDEFDIIEIPNDKFHNSSTVKYDNEEKKNVDIHSKPYRTLSLTGTQSSGTNSEDVGNHSAINGADNSVAKCPICFMIFSSTMTISKRSHHIQEHCSDD